MKNGIKIFAFLLFSLIMATGLSAQKKNKKVQKFVISKLLDLPAQDVWNIIGEDYGAIAYSHPKIVSSQYINGTLKAGPGAERICNFNNKGTRYLKEKIVSYDSENMALVNTVSKVGNFPLNPDYTVAIYKVEDLGNGKSKVSFDMEFRTKPAFMGAMAKGKFKKLIRDYMIAIEHHVKTGEKVTKQNFKKIRKQYS